MQVHGFICCCRSSSLRYYVSIAFEIQNDCSICYSELERYCSTFQKCWPCIICPIVGDIGLVS